MTWLKKAVGLLPPRVTSRLSSLQYAFPILRPAFQYAARRIGQGTNRIRHGVGKELLFDPHGGNVGYALGTSDLEEQDFLAQNLAPGEVFYDVGANKGFFAVLGARLVGREGHVYAFEPFPSSAEAVESNAKLNEQSQVTVIQAAVADRPGRDRLLLEGESSLHFRLSSSLSAQDNSTSDSISVEVISLDEFVAREGIRPPSLVKIDVEGAEVDVLKGMRQTIETHRPTVLCEVHWIRDEMIALVDEVFTPLGYTAAQMDGSGLPTEIVRYHAVFRPSELAHEGSV